jgi:hypothetical protein
VAAELPWRVRCSPSYALRTESGRQALLDELTARVVGLDVPVQVWHGPRPWPLPAGPVRGERQGEAAALARDLATSARARQTVLLPAGISLPTLDGDGGSAVGDVVGGHEGLALPAVIGESAGQLRLADGHHGRVLALTGWPASVTPGWLGQLGGLSAAVVVHLRPVPAPVASRLLRRRLATLTSTVQVEQQAGRLGDPRVDVAAGAAHELRHALALGTTRLLHTQVLLALAAEDQAALEEREQQVLSVLAGQLAEVRAVRFQQQPGWGACLPGGSGLRWPWRLLDATSVAASIPLPVGPDEPGRGVLAGVDPTCGAPLLTDRYAAHNPTRLVVGTSGAGKSYAAKLELIRQLVAGVRVVVVDPEGEFGQLADTLGGVCLAVGDEPAGLDPVGLACRPALAPAEGLSVLASWAAALLGGPLSAVDLALLDRALAVLRADRDSAPTPSDLLAVIAEIAAHPPFHGADLAARLAPAAGGTLAELFAPNPDLADPPPLVVFDLRSVPDRARPAVMACVLTWAWSQTVSAPVAQRQLIVLDEAHLLLDDPPAAKLLAQFARRARKYGVALEVITQRLSDFLGHPAGEAVLANAATKLLLGCEDHERTAIAAGLGLTEPEAALLRPDQRGSGLLLTPTVRTPVQVVAGPAEHLLASGGPR